jgi:hypothetical protein
MYVAMSLHLVVSYVFTEFLDRSRMYKTCDFTSSSTTDGILAIGTKSIFDLSDVHS